MSARWFSLVRWLPLGAAAALCVSCNGNVSMSYSEDRPVRVVPVRTHVVHVCTAECEHFYDGPRVVVLEHGHRHGPGCGHEFDGSHWIVIRNARVRAGGPPRPPHKVVRVEPEPVHVTTVAHVHGPGCGCVYHPQRRVWIALEHGHVHGPSCGHVFVEGRWVVRF